MAVGAFVLWGGRLDIAAGVIAGGLLSAISYGAIKSAIDVLVGQATSGTVAPRLRFWALVKFFTRYAMLALTAYVITAQLRLHAAGVVAGASSLMIAATAEAFRSARSASRSSPRS
jgi:hypothetical protein